MLSASSSAVVFPGQGSQVPDMRALVAAVRPDLLDAAVALVGEDPFGAVDASTRFAQPAIFCASLAGWARLRGHVAPVALAGHSLGELSALAAAGAVDEHVALELVVLRGRLMAESGEASGGGTMLAVLGGTPASAAALASRHGVTVANDNAPGQVVVSGSRAALEAAAADARAHGIRTLALDVAGAFHSPQMEDAVAPFRAALDAVHWHTPSITVLSSTTAAPFVDPAAELADALVRPVLWRRTVQALVELGASTVVDAGPGQVLAKLARRCAPGLSASTADLLLGDARAA